MEIYPTMKKKKSWNNFDEHANQTCNVIEFYTIWVL